MPDIRDIAVIRDYISDITDLFHEVLYPIKLGKLYTETADRDLFDQIREICGNSITLDFNPNHDDLNTIKKLKARFDTRRIVLTLCEEPTASDLDALQEIKEQMKDFQTKFRLARLPYHVAV